MDAKETIYRILHIEDDLMYKSVLKHALLKKFVDVEVYHAECEHDAMSILDATPPDLIIIDIDLKDSSNGLELSYKIKQKHPEIVMFILSQFDTLEYRLVAERNGVECFFSKSSSLLAIFNRIEATIRDKRISLSHECLS